LSEVVNVLLPERQIEAEVFTQLRARLNGAVLTKDGDTWIAREEANVGEEDQR
jgi:hypothetical protein